MGGVLDSYHGILVLDVQEIDDMMRSILLFRLLASGAGCGFRDFGFW